LKIYHLYLSITSSIVYPPSIIFPLSPSTTMFDALPAPLVSRILLAAAGDDARLLAQQQLVCSSFSQSARQVRAASARRASLPATPSAHHCRVPHTQALRDLEYLDDRNAKWLRRPAPAHASRGLCRLLRQCPALCVLHLGGAYSWVDDDVLAALGGSCPALRVLVLDNCERVTGAGLQSLTAGGGMKRLQVGVRAPAALRPPPAPAPAETAHLAPGLASGSDELLQLLPAPPFRSCR
jgi:hypothetical protein